MKVAFTSDVYWPRINGVTVSTNIFLNELTKRGHQMRLWAPAYPVTDDQKNLHHQDPRVSRIRSFGLFFSKEDRQPSPFDRRRFLHEIAEFNPDVVHIQTEFGLSLWARKYARKAGKPVVMTCHTYFEQYIHYYFPWFPQEPMKKLARRLTYHLFKHADAIISPTEPMKQVLRTYGLTCPITVVPTGIPEEDFAGVNKDEERQNSRWLLQFPQMKGRRILLYVGRVGQEKNMDRLLDVLVKVQEKEPQALLVVAGNGPYLDTYRANVAARGLEDQVLLLGYVQREELKHLYALADLFTFASVTETQGLVTIEAMMCGTPAVAVGKMGTVEVMGGDHGGFMVDDDADAFAAAVLKLLHDPQLYAAKSAEAKAHAQNWSAARMALRIENLYHELLGSGSA